MQVSLLELQRAFHKAVVQGAADAIAPWITADEMDAAARVAIYRNNHRTNLREALRADYPVVERLVGREFFDHAADACIAAIPSRSGDVGEYGDGFPEFLDTLPSVESLPYLADVARLERAWLQVFLGMDAAPGDFSGLAAIPPERMVELRFNFRPAMALLESQFPVLTIWRANQPDSPMDRIIDLDVGGERVLLCRNHFEVRLSTLSPGEYIWLTTLRAGASLGDAVNSAFAVQDGFDLTQALQRHIVEGTFISYTEEPNHER